ncbi:hypothetical protein HDU87_006497 [Geranomyces variabilis]|uniref:Uncharacterized protein n=1 Tax=Geranomyces variabilis TaxID=109894 RepID=A0AAD5XQI6_9FUNG|nr:hypothetical protein HDU87_006497 [Geranomyces variabilis]
MYKMTIYPDKRRGGIGTEGSTKQYFRHRLTCISWARVRRANTIFWKRSECYGILMFDDEEMLRLKIRDDVEATATAILGRLLTELEDLITQEEDGRLVT